MSRHSRHRPPFHPSQTTPKPASNLCSCPCQLARPLDAPSESRLRGGVSSVYGRPGWSVGDEVRDQRTCSLGALGEKFGAKVGSGRVAKPAITASDELTWAVAKWREIGCWTSVRYRQCPIRMVKMMWVLAPRNWLGKYQNQPVGLQLQSGAQAEIVFGQLSCCQSCYRSGSVAQDDHLRMAAQSRATPLGLAILPSGQLISIPWPTLRESA